MKESNHQAVAAPTLISPSARWKSFFSAPTAAGIWLSLALFCAVLVHLRTTWQTVTPFQGEPYNGTYQLLNPMRRIDSGQLPGRDMPVFHGIGIPWIHYPIYKLFGSDVFAAEISKNLVSRLLGIFVFVSGFYLLTRQFWPGVLFVSLGALAMLDNWPRIPFIFFSVIPGGSLYIFRSLMPLLFLTTLNKENPSWRWQLLQGLLLGLSWLFSIEQSASIFGAYFICCCVATICRYLKRQGNELRAWLVLLVGIGCAVLFSLVCVGFEYQNLIRFYFHDLPLDQVWYFGSPPNPFIADGSAESAQVLPVVCLMLAVFGYYWIQGARRIYQQRDPATVRHGWVFNVGAGYGILSLGILLGVNSAFYLRNGWRLMFILVAFDLFQAAWPRRIVWRMLSRPQWNMVLSIAAAVFIGITLLSLATYSYERPSLSDEWNIVAKRFTARIREAKPQPTNNDLWSLYAGIAEAELGIFHPHTDYIIHALAEKRADYIDTFAKIRPEFVTTLRRSNFGFEEWLQTTTWRFYERLIANYHIVDESERVLLWQRNSEAWIEPPTDWTELKVDAAVNECAIPAGPPGTELAVVRLRYEVDMPYSKLPILGRQARILVTAQGTKQSYPASLPPHVGEQELPLYLNQNQPTRLKLATAGLTLGTTIRLTSVAVRYLPETAAVRAIVPLQKN